MARAPSNETTACEPSSHIDFEGPLSGPIGFILSDRAHESEVDLVAEFVIVGSNGVQQASVLDASDFFGL